MVSSSTNFSVTLPCHVLSLCACFLICKLQGLHYVITEMPLRSVIIILLATFILKIAQNKTKSQHF